jgi:hypothetical protein
MPSKTWGLARHRPLSPDPAERDYQARNEVLALSPPQGFEQRKLLQARAQLIEEPTGVGHVRL